MRPTPTRLWWGATPVGWASARITSRRGLRPPCCASSATARSPNGQIIEYVDLETDRQEDYGLNVADNTPLYMWGVWHHWAQHADAAFRAEFDASMRAAAENLLGEIGPRRAAGGRARGH